MRINWKLEAHIALSTSYSVAPNSYINPSKRKMNKKTDILLGVLTGIVIMLPYVFFEHYKNNVYLIVYAVSSLSVFLIVYLNKRKK